MAVKTFREAYSVLQGHAETLREQQEPNIDDLLSLVTESVDAYKVCKERIDAVEKALEKALNDTGTMPRENSKSAKSAAPRSPTDLPEDEDIPF